MGSKTRELSMGRDEVGFESLGGVRLRYGGLGKGRVWEGGVEILGDIAR